jgi:SnoaL-like domain
VSSLTGEAADRQAIRDLVDAWARRADRRRPAGQAALFTADGTITVDIGDPASTEPVQRLQGHAEMAQAFKVLDTYDVATPSTARAPSRSTATGPPARPTAWHTTSGRMTAGAH